jgi:ATP synthase protein I
LIGVGSILTSIIVSGFILGYAVDVWLETQPVFMLSFGLLGIAGGILKVYKLLANPDLY